MLGFKGVTKDHGKSFAGQVVSQNCTGFVMSSTAEPLNEQRAEEIQKAVN